MLQLSSRWPVTTWTLFVLTAHTIRAVNSEIDNASAVFFK